MAIKRLSLPFSGVLARRARENQGLTLRDVADRCEQADQRIDHTTISRWENGVFGPTAPSLSILARALDVEISELCEDDAEGRPE
jgi:transcriptional regulator with XRE-family HTH domain